MREARNRKKTRDQTTVVLVACNKHSPKIQNSVFSCSRSSSIAHMMLCTFEPRDEFESNSADQVLQTECPSLYTLAARAIIDLEWKTKYTFDKQVNAYGEQDLFCLCATVSSVDKQSSPVQHSCSPIKYNSSTMLEVQASATAVVSGVSHANSCITTG